MIGVELMTRESAVSPTASVAAFLLLPRDCSSWPLCSRFVRVASASDGKTSMPFRISSPRMRNTFSAPALATAANGTRRPSVILAAGLSDLSLGTRAFRPRATLQLAPTARKYDWTMVEVEMGDDLFAFDELMATLSDWLVICQPRVPMVERFGVSIPAVTTKFDRTKDDMRKGRKTGSPVSVDISDHQRSRQPERFTWMKSRIYDFLCLP